MIRLCKSNVGCRFPTRWVHYANLGNLPSTTTKDPQMERWGYFLVGERETAQSWSMLIRSNLQPLNIHKWREVAQRETAQSWEMKKVRPMLTRSNLADAKHTREQFICVVENAAKGGFQISGFTSTSDSHASQPPEGAIWVTPTRSRTDKILTGVPIIEEV